jgi:hypothetical protein
MDLRLSYCVVHGCRFPWSHVTSAHVCGTCHLKGHGQTECNKPHVISRLRVQTRDDTLPRHMRCLISNCDSPATHRTTSHFCETCGDFGHSCCHLQAPLVHAAPRSAPPSPLSPSPLSLSDCIQPLNMKISCPICRKVNQISKNQTKVSGIDNQCVICWDKNSEVFMPVCGHICLCLECAQRLDTLTKDEKHCILPEQEMIPGVIFPPIEETQTMMGNHNTAVYLVFPAGMGCMWYLRRRDIENRIESFFMYADDWYNQPRTQQLNSFTNGYQFLNP